jgi:hypothetical protein
MVGREENPITGYCRVLRARQIKSKVEASQRAADHI